VLKFGLVDKKLSASRGTNSPTKRIDAMSDKGWRSDRKSGFPWNAKLPLFGRFGIVKRDGESVPLVLRSGFSL